MLFTLLIILFLQLTAIDSFHVTLSWAGGVEKTPSIGWGMVSEGGYIPTSYVKTGLRLHGFLGKGGWEAHGALSRYPMTYFGLPVSAIKGEATEVKAATFPTKERRFDYSGAISYPIFERALWIDLLGGYRGILLVNDFSNFDFGGPILGLQGSQAYSWGTVRLSGDVASLLFRKIKNQQNHILSFVGSESLSIFGDPTLVGHYRLQGWIPFKKAWRISLGYEGETLFFERVRRYYNGIFLSIA